MNATLIRAFTQSVAVLPALTAGAVTDIQWMPPGRQDITATGPDDEPVRLSLQVDAALAQIVIAEFQRLRAAAAAGTGPLPWLDFNHKHDEASGHPVEVYWGGEDAATGGIRIKVRWTDAGAAAITGKRFRSFSPEFYTNQKGEVVALQPNLGGLVNDPAFRSIKPLWARNGSGPSTKTNTNTMTPEQTKALADLQASVASLSEQLTAVSARAAAGAPENARLLALETELTNIKATQASQADAAAKQIVAKAVQEGRIPGANKELIAKWESLVKIDAANAAVLNAIAPNPALQRVIATASGDNGQEVLINDEATARKAEAAIQEYRAAHKVNYTAARSAVRAKSPELFGAVARN